MRSVVAKSTMTIIYYVITTSDSIDDGKAIVSTAVTTITITVAIRPITVASVLMVMIAMTW